MDLGEEGDFQACIDLESAYYHIQIHPRDWDFLGVQAVNPETGEKAFFRYKVLAFGLRTAAHALTRVTRPVIRFLHRQGIKFTMYIDDGRITASTKQKAQDQLETVKGTMRQAGFVLSKSKTDAAHQVTQTKTYLGLVVDSKTMKVMVSDEKIAKVQDSINALLQEKVVQVREIARVVGQVQALELATGPVINLFCRQAYSALKITEIEGWQCKISRSEGCKEDLAELCRRLPGLNGYPIRARHTAVALKTIFGVEDSYIVGRAIPAHRREDASAIVAGDASDSAVCSYTISSEKDFYHRSCLKAEEKTLSSGHRELLTVSRTLRSCGKRLEKTGTGATVYWVTDSTNLVAFLTKGSPKEPIQEEAIAVYRLAQRHNLHIIPIHTSREDPRIRIADAGSKEVDRDDWGIDVFSFNKLQKRYGPFSVDLFASTGNNRVERFYSPFAMPEAEGVDAFAHSWEGETAFICPPVHLIIPAWRKLVNTPMKAVVVVPNWPASLFWPIVFSVDEKTVSIEEFQPYILPGRDSSSVVMRGRLILHGLHCMLTIHKEIYRGSRMKWVVS